MKSIFVYLLLLWSARGLQHYLHLPVRRRGSCCKNLLVEPKTSDKAFHDELEHLDRNVTILSRGPNYIVALKPPSVVCHHSGWTGSRSKAKRGEIPEIPMLQRVRDAIYDIDSRKVPGLNKLKQLRKVNLVHRLDRGASGALLLTYADNKEADTGGEDEAKGVTAQLIDAMASSDSVKTYIALVRGEGILRGEDLKQKGWFEVTRAIKDEKGEEKGATTMFNFVAGQPEFVDENGTAYPRVSIVLARPQQGRWHQIRKHLNGLSHPILGDSTHGNSKTNRDWKERRNMPGERLCLHMARIKLKGCNAIPEGIDVSCPMLQDMLLMLKVYAPKVLEDARPTLTEEGILIEMGDHAYEVGEYVIPESILEGKKEKN
mmetsp:Transcript_17880/g.26450  ORF Transcript_17880/g.26450 Transcript_17880/m.26450 type:complete len:374 (+) Transcript_17880:24-1145(+)